MLFYLRIICNRHSPLYRNFQRFPLICCFIHSFISVATWWPKHRFCTLDFMFLKIYFTILILLLTCFTPLLQMYWRANVLTQWIPQCKVIFVHFTANRQAAAQYIPHGFIWQIGLGLLELAQNESCSVTYGMQYVLTAAVHSVCPRAAHAARGQPG